jgi:hypothetical protein
LEKDLLMADIKISDLTLAASALTTHQIEVNEAGVSKKVTGQQIMDLVDANLGTIAQQNSSSVTITGGSITGITDLAIVDGGTGASTAANARNNLLPAQALNTGKVLSTDGTNVSWVDTSIADGDKGNITVSGSGTVWTIDNDAITTTKILNSNVTGAKLENSGVTASTYGSGADVPVLTIDAKGRVTSASTTAIDYTGTLIGYTVYTSSTSYVKAVNNPSFIIVEVVGGGGSGGSGTYTRVNGGTTSFGAHCSATGGVAGGTTAGGGAGGVGSGGDLNATGEAGGNGGSGPSPNGGSAGFCGTIGSGGKGHNYSSGKDTAPAGAGGGGGYSMKKILNASLAGSETVTIGAGGNGSGAAAYDGIDGVVIVWQYS